MDGCPHGLPKNRMKSDVFHSNVEKTMLYNQPYTRWLVNMHNPLVQEYQFSRNCKISR